MSEATGADRVSTVEFGVRRLVIVLGILFAPLMETIDSSIVNVALPTIQGNLGATLDEAAWTVTGYLIANVIVIPLTPWLQARFGRRQYFVATTIGFTIVSLLCGLSTSISQLVVLRVVQGLFGGGLVATGQSALRDVFPPEQIGASQGVFALIVVVGPILAPVLGGAIIDSLSWQWVFFINIVPGVLSAAIVGTMLRNPQEPTRLPVDVLGIAFLVAAVGSLQYVLDEGERQDWFSSASILTAAILSAAGFVSFILWELYGTREPVVDLRIFSKYRSVSAGLVLGMGTAATFFGTTLILPQYVQNILGFPALTSGQLQLFRALPVLFMVPVIGLTVGTGKLDSRVMMAGGWIATAVSSFWLASVITGGSSFGDFVLPLTLGGVGSAMLFIPLLITIQSTTSAEDGPKASALLTLSFQLGGSVTSAAIVTLLDRRAAVHLDALAGYITLANPELAKTLSHIRIQEIFTTVLREAQTLAFADSAFVVGALAVLVAPLVILLKRQPRDMSGVVLE
jgi:DHA2 family multidrug resistance protein